MDTTTTDTYTIPPSIMIQVLNEHNQTQQVPSFWVPMPRPEEGDWSASMISNECPLLMRQWLIQRPSLGLLLQIEGMARYLPHQRKIIPYFTSAIHMRLMAVWTGQIAAYDDDDWKEIEAYFLES